MLRRKAEVFAPTDGVVYVCSDTDTRLGVGSDFSDPELMETSYVLTYRRMRVSMRDVELAESTECEITAKVEVRYAPALDVGQDVVLDNKVYDLTRIEQRGRTCWLWLSEIATDGKVGLVPDGITRDSHGLPVDGSDKPTEVYCRKVTHASRRVQTDGIDNLRPALVLRLRACDYSGQSRIMRDCITYTVSSVDHHGRWVDVSCARKVADR